MRAITLLPNPVKVVVGAFDLECISTRETPKAPELHLVETTWISFVYSHI